MEALPETPDTGLATSGSAIPALAKFEREGAKGIAHIAALKAAEELSIKFEGYASTSAGFIVAALAAVGFTADKLLNCAERTHALQAICEVGPLDLFGVEPLASFSLLS